MTEWREVEISAVTSQEEVEAVRLLWREYWEALRLPPNFQNFAEELRLLPSGYAPPGGRLLLARIESEAAGSAAFRPLTGQACEAKRLYVRPQYRSMGIGKTLLRRLFTEARAEGYSEMYCDTLSSMTGALRLYREIGFVEVGPYSQSPTPNAVFLKLSL